MDGIVAALIGRLDQDAELKYLDTGTAALKLPLAVFDSKAAERGLAACAAASAVLADA